MKIINGEIIPGLKIGRYLIGMCRSEIEGLDFSEITDEDGSSIVKMENAILWFDIQKTLRQIAVTYPFADKYLGKIGLSNTMRDVKENFGEYITVEETYEIKGVQGMYFELGDTKEEDNWNELDAPIDWIFVCKESNIV